MERQIFLASPSLKSAKSYPPVAEQRKAHRLINELPINIYWTHVHVEGISHCHVWMTPGYKMKIISMVVLGGKTHCSHKWTGDFEPWGTTSDSWGTRCGTAFNCPRRRMHPTISIYIQESNGEWETYQFALLFLPLLWSRTQCTSFFP